MRVLAALLACAALVAAVPALARGTRVKVGDDYYRSRTVDVHKGATVTWHWAGHRRHDVYFTSGRGRPARCKSRRRGSCSRRFPRRGTYSYVCTLHGAMTGRVVVR
jgi:plastocyanin